MSDSVLTNNEEVLKRQVNLTEMARDMADSVSVAATAEKLYQVDEYHDSGKTAHFTRMGTLADAMKSDERLRSAFRSGQMRTADEKALREGKENP